MKETKSSYFRCGTWIAIPVHGEWSPCLVVRKNRSASLILLYIFSTQKTLPPLDSLKALTAGESLSVIQTGMGDTWPIIGSQPNFNPAEWPIPPFSHVTEEFTLPSGEVVKSSAVLRRYDDKFNISGSSVRIPLEEAHHYYEDGLMGPLSAEWYISELIKTGRREVRGEKWHRVHLMKLGN